MDGAVGIVIVIWLAGFVLMIWALVDAIRVPDDSMYRAGSKLIWILVIVFTGFIGAIVYFVIGRPAGQSPGGLPPAAGSGGPLPPPPARPD